MEIKSRIYTYEYGDGEVTVKIEPDTIGIKEYNEKDIWNYINSELSSTLMRYIKDEGKRNEIIAYARKCFVTVDIWGNNPDAYVSTTHGFYTVSSWKHNDNEIKVEIELKRKKRK